MAPTEMTPGDQVVFDRLDVAEALGIWRHATGRVIGTGDGSGQQATVDVQFEGHAPLHGYLATLFKKRLH